jgi:UPF0176 protein
MPAASIPISTCVTVAAFYKFVAIGDPAALQHDLRGFCGVRGIKGTILVASEGINATVSGAESDVAALIEVLRADARFSDLAVKFSEANGHPFQRLKVKVKREIVTLGVAGTRPSALTAPAVEPEDWNALISEPGVLVIDTRNDYEFEVGTFTGARNPRTRSFSEFPDFAARELAGDRQRKIAMFCTGGIRCEKASAHLMSEGFTRVYQLSGGILKYLERISPADSLWRGECFVFDERVALEHGVRRGHHGLCARCGHPVRLAAERDDTALCAACGDGQTVSADISNQVEPAEF